MKRILTFITCLLFLAVLGACRSTSDPCGLAKVNKTAKLDLTISVNINYS